MNQSNGTHKIKTISENLKSEIIDFLQKIVQNGVYGRDYTVAPREKNRKLREKYCINDEKIKEILLSLRSQELVKIEGSNNVKHLEDVICVFKLTYPLLPKWEEDADYEDVPLYVKMVKPEDGEPLFIISFHEDE